MGERDRGSTVAIGYRTTGREITASPRLTLLDNRSTSRAGWARETAAAARSPAPWRTCQKADVQRDGGTRSLTGSRAVGTFDVCSNAAVNSDLSCFLYTL